MGEQHPLKDQKNWNKEKIWVVPLKITAMVDDVNKYDDAMENFVKNLRNEIRSLAKRLEKQGINVETGEAIKDPESAENVFKAAKGEVVSKDSLKDMVADILKQGKKDK